MLVCRLRRCSDGEEGTRGWHWNLLDCPHSCPWHSLAPLFAGIGKGQRVARRAEATRPQGCAVAREAARLRYREATMRHACSAGQQGCEAAALQAVSMRGCGAASSRGRADRAHGLRAHRAAGLPLRGSSSARPHVRGGCACTWADVPLHPHTELRCAGKQLRAKGIRGKERASGTSLEALNLEQD